MTDKLTVAIIGCGRLGQHYVEVYNILPDTEVVALVEPNPGRRQAVGERFGVDGLFADVEELYRRMTPDLAAVVLPAKFIQEAVTASAEAGVRGVSTDKPIGARLADVDAMIEACESRGVVFAGGNLVRAMSEVQEAAAWLRAGDFGELRGAAVHSLSTEISGGGCQQIAVMRLFTGAEVAEVTAWGSPREALESGTDKDLAINGLFRLSSGIECPVFSSRDPCRGVDVWTDDALVRWSWALPEIWQGFDASGARIRVERPYKPIEYPRFTYLGTSIRSFIDVVRHGGELRISGRDLLQSLEVAIAARESALRNAVPVSLPLQDRSLTLYPTRYRWLGGDNSGREQSVEEARTMPLFPHSS